MPNKEMLVKAAEKFINKVESGRARSHETYSELKAALAANESVPLDALVIKKNGGRDPFLILNVFLYSNYTWGQMVITKNRSNEVKEPIHIALKNLQDKLNEGIPNADIVIKADWFADS